MGATHDCRFRLSGTDGRWDALREREVLPVGYGGSFGPGRCRDRAPSPGFREVSGNPTPVIPGVSIVGLQEEGSVPGCSGGGEPGSRNGMQRGTVGKPAVINERVDAG
ncbi:hypothetical protein DSECCO2_371210 [anaerobic digester metagenome]